MGELVSNKTIAVTLTRAALLAHLVYRDYRAWYQLGPGGLPRTPSGWLKQLVLKPMCSLDVQSVEFFDSYMSGYKVESYLHEDLKPRLGSRPSVGHWTAPQRQLDARASSKLKEGIESTLGRIASSNPDLLEYGPSKLDGGGTALFTSLTRGPPKHQAFPLSPNELLHMHEIDGSIHCTLSAADAKLLTQKGWGERHGLNGKLGFPRGYLFVFAPRDQADLLVLEGIARAAARYGLQGAALA